MTDRSSKPQSTDPHRSVDPQKNAYFVRLRADVYSDQCRVAFSRRRPGQRPRPGHQSRPGAPPRLTVPRLLSKET